MSGLEKLKTISVISGSVALPTVLALVGHRYTEAQNQREFGLKYVELAVSILAEEPKNHNRELRGWAVTLPEKVKKDLTIQRLDVSNRIIDRQQYISIEPRRPTRRNP